ncbi:hypothetical protein BKA62DRAFT_713948 [Auriculariales sp. MPI-PUGE-AT-0066]|nr:hypothetical protein BKA62DRAFT_713948 [Auriculariales sp. MPI-PUGE-AT-0066]
MAASSYELYNSLVQTSWNLSSSPTSFTVNNALFLSQQANLTPFTPFHSPTAETQSYIYDLSAAAVGPKSPRVVAPSRRPSPPSPTSSTSSQDVRAPRTMPLHRGEACLHCRKRKIRCDANKPSCGSCARNGHSCEYEVSPYLLQIQKLESENAQLRARLATLEATSTSCSSYALSGGPSPHAAPVFQPHDPSTGYASLGQHTMIW